LKFQSKIQFDLKLFGSSGRGPAAVAYDVIWGGKLKRLILRKEEFTPW